MTQLYAHQQKIVDADPKKCGLFLGTGSGKTRTALVLARGKTLIIMPKTQYEDRNWERELETIWNQKDVFLDQVTTITTISKEAFRRDWEKLGEFETVIVDEAHTMCGVTPNIRWRNKKAIPKASQLFEALNDYLKANPPKRLYLCTATITRSPMTVWAAAKLLGEAPSWHAFREKYYTRLPMPGREVYVPKSNEKLKDDLAKFILKIGFVGRLEDYFDVPSQVYRNDYVKLKEGQIKRLKSIPVEFPDPIVQIGKKHQIENGVLSGGGFGEDEIFDNEKLEKILDYAFEFPRMVIFVKYRKQIEQIQNALTEKKYCTWTLTGDTVDRGGVIKQANELDGVLIVQAQISAGWEIPNTPVMLFASRTYSFVDYDQALGRIQRANNIKKNLYINLIVKDGIDEAVHDSIENKKDFSEKVYIWNNIK